MCSGKSEELTGKDHSQHDEYLCTDLKREIIGHIDHVENIKIDTTAYKTEIVFSQETVDNQVTGNSCMVRFSIGQDRRDALSNCISST